MRKNCCDHRLCRLLLLLLILLPNACSSPLLRVVLEKSGLTNYSSSFCLRVNSRYICFEMEAFRNSGFGRLGMKKNNNGITLDERELRFRFRSLSISHRSFRTVFSTIKCCSVLKMLEFQRLISFKIFFIDFPKNNNANQNCVQYSVEE